MVPYVKLGIEEEDSLGIDKYNEKKDAKIKISVIKLKHISNFTDIDALSHYSDVSLKYVKSVNELGKEDVIIIPGSKNTIEDMKDLVEKDMARKIIRLAKSGTVIFGICGGFQILGQKIMDLNNLESNLREISGLGLLSIETVIETEKITTQYENTLKNVSGILSGMENIKVNGYEIHQGYSYLENSGKSESLKEIQKNCIFGEKNLKGMVRENVIGTYVHGIFDNFEFTNNFLNRIRENKGLEYIDEKFSYSEYKDREYNKLAKVLRENIDIKKIYEIIKK